MNTERNRAATTMIQSIKSYLDRRIVQLVVNMARMRVALSILIGLAAAVEFALGQVMMVPPPMILGHPNHPRHVGHLLQPVQITERPEYPTAQEPLDEARLQQRIKELETSKQSLRQKQMELEDKIAYLHDEALRCEKQIAGAQQEIHKLEELERLHYLEQDRLERLIEQQRVAEYQEKLHQERLAQQRAFEEMNREGRQRSADRRTSADVNDEIPANVTYEARTEDETSETYKHRLDEAPVNDSRKGTIRSEGVAERAHKNERPHSTVGLLMPKPSIVQETMAGRQTKVAPMVKHVIEKKEVHDDPPKKELIGTNGKFKIDEESNAPLLEITGSSKTKAKDYKY